MVDVDNLSDEQLRTKLLEFGFPVMPITGTTRQVMKKKLKLLLENKTKSNKDKRRSLGRYSSEEESDTEVKVLQKNRRVTMAAPLMQPPPPSKVTQRKSTMKNNDVIHKREISEPKKEIKSVSTSTTVRTAKILQAAHDEFDTGSESDEIADNYSDNSFRHSSPINKSPLMHFNDYTSPLSSSFNRNTTPPTFAAAAAGGAATTSTGYNNSFSTTSSPGRLPSSFASVSNAADIASDRLNQIRTRLSLGSPSYEKTSFNSTPSKQPIDDLLEEKENTPFLSNFTKRLSQMSENPKSYNYRNDIIKENDLNGSGTTARNYLNSYRSTKMRAPLYNNYRSDETSAIFKNISIPCMVLVIACLFFVCLGVIYMYMGIRTDTAIDAAAVPICSKTNPNTLRYLNCVLENDVADVKNLLRVLLPELTQRAIANKCINNQIKPQMSEREIIDFITKNYALKDEFKIESDLKNLEVLTFVNPNWGISVAKLDNPDDLISERNVMRNMDSLAFKDNSNLTCLIILNPSLPWTCRLINTIYICYNFFIFLCVGVFILYIGNLSYKYYKLYNQRHNQEIISMVENIIDVLQSNTNENNSENNFMVINHVRDMILPIEDRKKKRKVWTGAVKYISDFESRIRTEVQVVQGEPSEVWRWLGGVNLSISGSSKNKSWQGQAFETQIGSVNSLQCSPTPCLKIRGMFDEGDRNTLLIKKAVLSKCANQCRILHCSVDTNSNCVYLKCADQSDAAIAYRNLHGWWYSGNLVTVKYLRLERYMQRFPDSPVSGPPFLQVPV